MQPMRSTLSSARPITVLLILLGLDAGGAMAQNSTPNPNLANQVCCDADAGSQISAPTIIACTDYPEGRVGRFWSGQIVCLSDGNGGYPKTAAGVLPCPRSYVLCGAKGNQRHLSNPPAPPHAPCPFPPHPTAPCCLGSVRVPPPCSHRNRQSTLSNLCPRYEASVHMCMHWAHR